MQLPHKIPVRFSLHTIASSSSFVLVDVGILLYPFTPRFPLYVQNQDEHAPVKSVSSLELPI